MASVPFITGGTVTSATQTDGAGNYLGFWFRNDSGEPVVITDLGRWQRTGNTQTHSLRIYSTTASGATGTLEGSVSVNCSGAPVGEYLYGTLASPVTIAPGGQCVIASEEFTGGDTFGSNGGTAFVTTDIGSTWSGYVIAGVTTKNPDSGRGYGPTNFKYSAPVAVWSKAGNVYTTDGNRYSVQSAINDSTEGDIIDIPAGSFTWGASGAYLDLNKAVTLRGAGTGSTTINISATGGTYTNATIRVSAAATLKDFTIQQPSSASATSAINCGTANGWRITNIVYNSDTVAENGYFVYFTTFGLIDNCTITGGVGSDEWIFGRGPSDAWQSASNKGTANAVYVENCVLTGQGYLDANANASVVVRNCSITPTAGAIKLDGHGQYSNSPSRSFRLMECYRNTWTTSNGSNPCFEIRGGTGFIWDNVSASGPIYLGDYRVVNGVNTVSDYPLYDQVGTGQDPFPASTAAEPLYLWNNTRSSGGANWAATQAIYGTSMVGLVNPDRDYFDTSPGFNGTSGTGRGTRAQMDAITPTLTGVGFWVTDEGSWDTTLSANTSGRFYRWNGSVWVLYYTPYTYPHPLRTGEDTTPPTPNPSTIASVTVNSASQITVVADEAVDAVSSPVEYNHSIDGTYQGWQSSETRVFTGLTANTEYSFRVKARDAEGNETTQSSATLETTSSGTSTPNPLAFRSNAMLALGAF